MTEDNGGEVCGRICQEARETLDKQIYRNENVDRKAIGIFRLNLLLAGLLLTVFTLMVNNPELPENEFINVWSVAALVSLLLSTVFAAMTYTSTSYDIGIGPDIIEDSKFGRYDSSADLERELREVYRGALIHNRNVGQFNAYFITIAIAALLDSVILFVGGGAVTFLGYYDTYTAKGFFILSVFGLVILNLVIWKADWIFSQMYTE
ncbi:hypothetical protein [Halorussus amylolyticus]|uniref:hypothetical protein n=1 Tax=Halorussus amylolyticus TaxID=1126242 RepID=UPI001044BB78|nr:hypothetical protein [Halorussus amylolyticus]